MITNRNLLKQIANIEPGKHEYVTGSRDEVVDICDAIGSFTVAMGHEEGTFKVTRDLVPREETLSLKKHIEKLLGLYKGEPVSIDAPEAAVRNYVSQYNKKHGTSFQVKKVPDLNTIEGHIMVIKSDNIEDWSEISFPKYREWKERMQAIDERLRNRVVSTALESGNWGDPPFISIGGALIATEFPKIDPVKPAPDLSQAQILSSGNSFDDPVQVVTVGIGSMILTSGQHAQNDPTVIDMSDLAGEYKLNEVPAVTDEMQKRIDAAHDFLGEMHNAAMKTLATGYGHGTDDVEEDENDEEIL